MALVLLLLDAFRHDYLTAEKTPFLWKCAQEGAHYEGVEQSLGFCERSEILTGLQGDKTGFFTAIGFDPPNSPYSKMALLSYLDTVERVLLLCLRLFPSNFSSRVHKKLRYWISCRFRKLGIAMPSYLIPYSWLPYFALTEDRVDHRNPAAFPTPSILSLLEKAGMTYYYATFSALNMPSQYLSDYDRLDAVVRDAKVSSKDLYLVYIAATDSYGHRYGPDSTEFKEALQQLDMKLNHFVHDLEHISPGNHYLFLGDHGMVTVTKRVNVEKEISRLLRSYRLRKGRDVIYFLDSTMVRFWAMSDKAHVLLPEMLKTSEIFNGNGSWMNDVMASRNHVPWPDRRYGDHLWIAKPGVLVFPDFFHRLTPCRGMHGYDPSLPESRGMCILWGDEIPPSKHPVIPLIEVFNILRRNLKL